MAAALGELETALDAALDTGHGDLFRWQGVLNQLPEVVPSSVDLAAEAVRIGTTNDLTDAQHQHLHELIQQLHPWRKGPFELFGIVIDSEWRSNLKWARIADKITSLEDRTVLDVGCGNGYYALRMLGAGARCVVGIDPTWLFVVQFAALKHYLPDAYAFVLPLSLEQFPETMAGFDTVFSMGVLYHRRSPIDHLLQLKQALRPGGELVLETLVIEHEGQQVLVPEGRYAKMRNVWFIPSTETMEQWLGFCGLEGIELLDCSPTTTDEQRATDWIHFESLADYLDPNDHGKTIEGHPAPVRAVWRATRPA